MICSTRDSTGDTSLPWLELVTSLSIRGSLYFLTTDQRRFCPGRLYVGNVLCYIDMVRVKNSLDCWVLIDHNNHWATELPANTIITNWIYTDDKVVCQKHGWSYLQICRFQIFQRGVYKFTPKCYKKNNWTLPSGFCLHPTIALKSINETIC